MGSLLPKPARPAKRNDLADRINAAHRLAAAAASAAIEHAREAGRLLIEAKAQCDHGNWLTWLKDHFEGSARTAQAYMRVAERWPAIESTENAQRVAHLSFREAVRLTAEPRDCPARQVEPTPTAEPEPEAGREPEPDIQSLLRSAEKILTDAGRLLRRNAQPREPISHADHLLRAKRIVAAVREQLREAQ
jgi:hypothetical protein